MQIPPALPPARRAALRKFAAMAPLSLVLVLVSAFALPGAAARVNIGPDEETGELMGDLMFHADLMSSLDTLCPRRVGNNWRAVVDDLPTQARTRELQELSRRLSAEAARSMVKASGGCKTRDYGQLYAETRRDYEILLERWARYSI